KWKRSAFDSVAEKHPDRYRHEPERNRPAPDRARHRTPDSLANHAETEGLGTGGEVRDPLCKRGMHVAKDASPQAGGPTLGAGFTGLELYLGPGKRLWILGKGFRQPVCSSENAQGPETRTPTPFEVLPGYPVQIAQRLPDRLPEQSGGLVVVGMGPGGGLG